MAGQITTIFFDVGNTLLFRDQKTILAPLHQHNIFPSDEQLYAVERRTKAEFDAAVEHGKVDRSFWDRYYEYLLRDMGLPMNGVHEKLVAATQLSANWCKIRPGTREVLGRLGQRFRLGVISNADGKIADVLAHCGIAQCFLTITDSGLVGHEKPHTAIFAAALEQMKAAPAESMYVGDVYSVDYAGAVRAGMQATLFDVAGAYRESGLPRVESMEELESKLG